MQSGELVTEQQQALFNIVDNLLQEPYMDPLPEEKYIFDRIADVSIELGQAVDPQGGQVDVSVEFGDLKMLEYKDGLIQPKAEIPEAVLTQIVVVGIKTVKVTLTSTVLEVSREASYAFDIVIKPTEELVEAIKNNTDTNKAELIKDAIQTSNAALRNET